eukprot:CAMPEP_0204213474 /NCGR_PEP_ID=MMETSP0361-20130328/76013_1 /ASSEMBLY_ACC=CAM_ASM_000343 /TAXON_ID=268821 /ORGANISM="Scrippsiella Hangoei, Strain SHTV-5" /LENGTH=58 /DNA_ID=CAMNT_0051177947 /DNA_START=121 /DNA_END=294 /DNA_ORIENTATION=-
MSCGNRTIVFATWEPSLPKPSNHCTLGFKLASKLQLMSCGNLTIVFATWEPSMPKPFN